MYFIDLHCTSQHQPVEFTHFDHFVLRTDALSFTFFALASLRSEVLAVGARCHPVEQLFLDDLQEQFLGIWHIGSDLFISHLHPQVDADYNLILPQIWAKSIVRGFSLFWTFFCWPLALLWLGTRFDSLKSTKSTPNPLVFEVRLRWASRSKKFGQCSSGPQTHSSPLIANSVSKNGFRWF